ncbi:hypothetical protein FVE85_7130 [Porphyridium purpureum]|uniref:Hemerythrin-like domain-containing protein n=1 Tax=Porphyridium purpureum TaxID=35688 RepID=A0A5J4Z8B5_PORPP|nr:hypothetical protein FVE85_7130 [Porphyridium purpureum]|eukprot:POR8103..scf295_1
MSSMGPSTDMADGGPALPDRQPDRPGTRKTQAEMTAEAVAALENKTVVVRQRKPRKGKAPSAIDKAVDKITGGNYFLGTGDLQSNNKRREKFRKTVIVKMPVVIATPYGKLWSMDVLAVYHNAIKKEVMDMYNMVECMLRFQMSLGYDDVTRFFEWWDVFESFLMDYFELEEKVIFPYIAEKFDFADTKLSRQERMLTKARITQFLAQIDDMEDIFINRPPGECLPRFVEFLDKFTPRLLGYFNTQETIVPRTLQKFFQPDDKVIIQQTCVDWLKKTKDATDFAENMVVQSRWMPEAQLQLWKRDSLRGMQRVAYPAWRGRVEAYHFVIPAEFGHRVLEDELEALQV